MRRGKYLPIILFFLIVIAGISVRANPSPQNQQNPHISGALDYVGAEACGTCHAESYTGWNGTNHAHMAGIAVTNASGTFYWVHTPTTYVLNETYFVARCAKCHVTGWNATSKTWPEKGTDPGKFLNLQCEGCHGPGTGSMTVNYSSSLCGTCHTQYGDMLKSAHNNSTSDLFGSGHAMDSCLSCMSTQGFLGLTVHTNSTGLEPVSCAACHDPHSAEFNAQMRFENSTALCSSCHTGSHHPQGDLFAGGPHDMAGIECASCHGNGTRLSHGAEGPWMNHTFSVIDSFYPFNYTEPQVCSHCHSESWAISMLGNIQSTVNATIQTVNNAITSAQTAITNATQKGADPTIIAQANALVKQAKGNVSMIQADGSLGFHNPMKVLSILNTAQDQATQALLLVTTPVPEIPVEVIMPLFMLVTFLAVIFLAFKKARPEHRKP